MGGLFGLVSRENCITDLFYGVDYHSHLGTTIGGLAVLSDRIMKPICHDLTNSQFKTEFKDEFEKLSGHAGIGVISSLLGDKQPLLFRSKLGTFALCTDGFIKNAPELFSEMVATGTSFKEIDGTINQTELVGELICRGSSITNGISTMYQKIQGSISLLLLSEDEEQIYASGGVFPLVVGKKATSKGDSWAIASETTAFPNLKYEPYSYPRYQEVVSIGDFGVEIRMENRDKIVFCPFLHIYFDFPASSHYGINGEIVRERCGGFLAENDNVKHDSVMGVADSGIPHAYGYTKRKMELALEKSMEALNGFEQGTLGSEELATELRKNLGSIAPLRRPVIKFTAGWGRSYMPPQQSTRELIAHYKQIPNAQLIADQAIVLVDDSIRRGTQLRRFLTEKLDPHKPKAIHVRIASPPQLFPCYFDETTKEADLIARKAIEKIEGSEYGELSDYQDVSSPKYKRMVDLINEFIGATSLKYISIENMCKAIVEAPRNVTLHEENLCTYCWTGRNPFLANRIYQSSLN